MTAAHDPLMTQKSAAHANFDFDQINDSPLVGRALIGRIDPIFIHFRRIDIHDDRRIGH
jgi:hypothetical protein